MNGGIAVAESHKPRRAAKVLKSMTIEPRLGGGHTITHHYTSYQHESEPHEFEEHEGAKALKHIAKHAGMPHPQIGEEEDDEPEPKLKDREARNTAL